MKCKKRFISLSKGLKVLVLLVLLVTVFSNSSYAQTNSITLNEIKTLVEKAQNEKLVNGEASDNTIKLLNEKLDEVGISTGSYGGTHEIDDNDTPEMITYGYGQTHELGGGWTYRVDKPGHGGEAKPHVHVINKKLGIDAAETCDQKMSHKKTLDKVPKKIKEKVRESKDYKKGKADLSKMKEAKKAINDKHLNLNNAKDLAIAAGIFITIVGVAFFAPEFLPVALAAI